MSTPDSVRRPVVLDTDIGTDVDDVFALATLLGSPEVDLVGSTMVYGDVLLRARLATRMLRLAGRADVPVVAGEADPISGKSVFWGGWEGVAQPDLAAEPIDEKPHAVDFLATCAREHAGELDLIAVGPLTNVARAIQRYPDFAGNLRHLYVMGGWFGQPARAEHNFACDADAAAIVMAAGVPITVTGLEITQKSRLGFDELDAIAATDTPITRFVEAEAQNYWGRHDTDGSSPHDPLSVLTLIRPELFEFRSTSVEVSVDGVCTSTPLTGPTRVTTSAAYPELNEEIVRRVQQADARVR